MRTTPLENASPTSARKPALKRRKLNHATDPGCLPSRALADNSNVPPTLNNTPALSLCGKLSCSTCHRALPTAIQPGVAGPSVCSRCSAPTCAICARTCTSYTRPSSFPSTPALTRSPSPTTHILAPVSPKRVALSLSYAATNGDVSVPPASAKRKKAPLEQEDVDGDDPLDGTAVRDHTDAVSAYDYAGDTDSVVIPGCGRVVCRACCVESVPNDGKLCVDCFALV